MAEPLRSAIQIGGDEHFEVTKALLWARGYPLYESVWNDQPPLHTVILGTLFKWFGPTMGVARSLSVCFGLLLLAGCFHMVRHRGGFVAGAAAVLCLLVAPHVFPLSVSVMLEIPAFATALWALWPLWRWAENRHWPWLVFSGAVLAAALQIKLTAALLGPALALELLLALQGGGRSNRARQRLQALIVWGGSIVCGFLLIGSLLGSAGLDLLWDPHFSPHVPGASAAPLRAFSVRLVLEHTEAACGLGVGLCLLAWRRDWRHLAFPLVLLATVSAVHSIHRPWWFYYYLHFALPLAWIAGYAVAAFLQIGQGEDVGEQVRGTLPAPIGPFSALCMIVLVVWCGGRRLWADVEGIRALPRREDSVLLARMKAHGERTEWVYTRSSIYPFHAGLLVPPPLAVLPAKRFLSGLITAEKILSIVKQYRPQQLLLPATGIGAGETAYVDANYEAVYREEGLILYVSKDILDAGGRRGR